MLGSAVVLALATTILSGCNQAGNSGNGNAAGESSDTSETSKTSGIKADESSAKQIREAIGQATKNGLRPDLFLKGGESEDQLVQAAYKYASALANGYSDPNKLFDVYTIPRPNADVRAGLQQALQKGHVGEWFDSLAPQTDEYRALGAAFQRYAKLAGDQKDETIDTSSAIKPGQQDDRIPKIAAFLRAAGYLKNNGKQGGDAPGQQPAGNKGAPNEASRADAQPAAPVDKNYTPQMVQAVKAYQADSGLKADGILGGNTLGSLNNGAVDRARQLAAAMERLRWMKRDPANTRIDVNTAASFLDYYRDGQHVDHRKVINGEPDKPTPQLQAPVYQLVAKPTWTVPKGIAANELANKGDAWLKNNDFIMKNGYYVQQSGPKSALGLVKFDMKDDQAIYLHDTPAKSVFGLDDRHRSHGCVRVENAVQFANALAQQEGVYDQFNQAMQKRDESFVKLPNELPVRLLYQTAFWDGSRIRFVPDVYGWDNNIAKALNLAPGQPQQIKQPESGNDLGP